MFYWYVKQKLRNELQKRNKMKLAMEKLAGCVTIQGSRQWGNECRSLEKVIGGGSTLE
jgi:hypothetical protein